MGVCLPDMAKKPSHIVGVHAITSRRLVSAAAAANID